jgi:hypothetical protein
MTHIADNAGWIKNAEKRDATNGSVHTRNKDLWFSRAGRTESVCDKMRRVTDPEVKWIGRLRRAQQDGRGYRGNASGVCCEMLEQVWFP